MSTQKKLNSEKVWQFKFGKKNFFILFVLTNIFFIIKNLYNLYKHFLLHQIISQFFTLFNNINFSKQFIYNYVKVRQHYNNIIIIYKILKSSFFFSRVFIQKYSQRTIFSLFFNFCTVLNSWSRNDFRYYSKQGRKLP